jgi:hypothetical protein
MPMISIIVLNRNENENINKELYSEINKMFLEDFTQISSGFIL